MNKYTKIALILALVITIVGSIVVATCGFNVELRYRESTQVGINIGKEFKESEIKDIAKEVFNQDVVIQTIEIYKDMAQITIARQDVTDEQIEALVNKVNEKYETTLDKSAVSITYTSNVRIRDIMDPYVCPILFSVVIAIAYFAILYKKNGIFKVLYTLLLSVFGTQAVFFGIIAIFRIPFGRFTMPMSMSLFILVLVILGGMYAFDKKEEESK